MQKLKSIWNDPVWSKVIASFIVLLATTIIPTAVQSISRQTTFWETLATLVHSPVFILTLIVVLLLCYIIVDKIMLVRTRRKKEELLQRTSNQNDGRYSWDDINQGVACLMENLRNDGYIPSLLVGVGRGGCIISALLSGNMIKDKHIPFIALEREYEEEKGMKTAKLFEEVILSKKLDRVLLVAGDVFTGKTAKAFMDYLLLQGAKEVRFLVFTKVNSTNLTPDYYYTSTDVTKLFFPWMLTDNYITDARTAGNTI